MPGPSVRRDARHVTACPRGRRRGALLALFGVLLVAATLPSAAALPAPAAAAPWTGRDFPARYDLRKLGRVSRVGLQDHYGTCWVFAAIGSLESCLLPGTTLDLSENHMADFDGSRLTFGGRAPSTVSTAYVARWEGPVLERDDPYPHPGASREGLPAVRHVQEVLFLPRRSSARANAAVKWAVMQFGAVDASMAYEASGYNAATSAYNSRSTDVDHHVCVVGWDDAYPAGRFLRRPPGPGAFLIKNSWGRSYGQGGYFWVSYYDRSFGTTFAVFNGSESARNHDAIYQHDALGWSRSIGFGSTTGWFAARYTSGGDGSVTAASFYTPGPGATYEVRVAPTLEGVATAPVAGSGTLAVGGYHTVALTAPVAVTTGADFVVAVRLTTPGSRTAGPGRAPDRAAQPSCRRRALLRQPRRRRLDGPAHALGLRRLGRVPQGVRRLGGRTRRGCASRAPRARRGRSGQDRPRALHAHGPGVLERVGRRQAPRLRRPRQGPARAARAGGDRQRARHLALRGAEAARGLQDRRPRLGRHRASRARHDGDAAGALRRRRARATHAAGRLACRGGERL